MSSVNIFWEAELAGVKFPTPLNSLLMCYLVVLFNFRLMI